MEEQNLIKSSQTDTDDGSFPPEDLDSYNLIEPPPLDWRSDSSSEACSLRDEAGLFCTDGEEYFDGGAQNRNFTPQTDDLRLKEPNIGGAQENHVETMNNNPEGGVRTQDVDHSHIQTLLDQLQLLYPHNPPKETEQSCLMAPERSTISGLLFTESHQKDLLQLLEEPEPHQTLNKRPTQTTGCSSGQVSQVTDGHREAHLSQAAEEVSGLYDSGTWHFQNEDFRMMLSYSENQISDWVKESKAGSEDEQGSHGAQEETEPASQPSFKNVPGPCDAEDLLDGIIFGAKYLGSTQLQSERNPSTNARMAQAQEAVDRIKAPEGESQPMTEVDLFISTKRIKVLNAVTQEAMMDHSLQMISYIADIGNLLVLMVRRKSAGHNNTDSVSAASTTPKKCWMICHVFSSVDAHVIAQAIGQAFGVAYQQFLQENGISAEELRPGEFSLSTQELYNGDLVHFSRSENIKEVCISKPVGEILGIAIVESGWGSILPTVVVANLLHGGAAERSGELSIGDRIMSVNGASLVGLSITACHDIIRDLKGHSRVKLSIVHCPPVTMAIIKRPNPKYQLGFSVEDGIICSLMRGGIAERGGIRVGHRIIEVNGQSVVATPHEKIIQILTEAVGEIHLKTMPVSTYRLLTGQDQPVYL